MSTPSRVSSLGFLYALLAYVSWGVFPIYWKFFGRVSPLEIISHRVVWSLVLVIALVAGSRQFGELLCVLRDFKRLGLLFLTASLLSVNWGIFVYGVISGQVVQTSLGYFINPLVSVVLALVFLKEQLTRWQVVAVVIAALGVFHYAWHLGHWPWIALGLAVTFALYGLLRKVVAVTPLVGLAVETMLMFPVALGMILSLSSRNEALFGGSLQMVFLFMGAGVVTTLPLWWFNSATKLLPLSTMGFLQYVAPTLQLLCGVVIYHEPFTYGEGLSFLLIWVAIGIFLTSLLRVKPPQVPVPPAD